MKLPQTGGCQCGELRYEITQAPQLVCTCHCADCQCMTSSAFSMALVLRVGTFRLVRGEPKAVQRIADSGRVTTRWVCPECGSWICGGIGPDSTPRNVRAALWTIPLGCSRPCIFGLAANRLEPFYLKAIKTSRRSLPGTPGGRPLFDRLSLTRLDVNRLSGVLARHNAQLEGKQVACMT